MQSYTVRFGLGDPRGFTGLSPTFLLFWNLVTGTTNTPPAIAELITGSVGIYGFSYGVTQSIAYLLDAATTSPGATYRYVSGQLNPADRINEYGDTLIGMANSLVTYVGTTASSIGSTGVDPSTVMGFLMRAQEMAEGNQTYTKATGTQDFYTRGTTLIKRKTISDSSSSTTKT